MTRYREQRGQEIGGVAEARWWIGTCPEPPRAATRALVRLLGRCPMKTATNRAAEGIEAAERMYVDETGGTLNLRPARRWPKS